ncbi:AAA family ATPase [Microbacterium sp.]|uniref:AAA family ATPase n=1 Tax=Microbacterium sp. TaxID=51671 RepID=UPI003A83F4B4
MKAVVAVDGRRGRDLAEHLAAEDVDVQTVVDAVTPAAAATNAMAAPAEAELLGHLARSDLLIVTCTRDTVTAELVGVCDRFGVRLVALCAQDADRRVASIFGVDIRDRDADAADILASSAPPADEEPVAQGRIIVVWGAAGAPGRSTVAVETACELARQGRHTALVDADSSAPSIALATGLADEGPGFAAACRQAGRGALTPAELTRICEPLGDVDVLTGINRVGRWPELDRHRVRAALEACRAWADDTVVDVAATLEQDEEIVSDLDGPRRNAATLAALGCADLVVAVVAADPVSVARFVRAYPDLRASAPGTRVRVVVNKTRGGALGIDARGQVRRTLERFAGIDEAWFLPWDVKSTDGALLASRPIAHSAPRSPFSAAVRRFVTETVMPAAPATPATRRGLRRQGVRTA